MTQHLLPFVSLLAAVALLSTPCVGRSGEVTVYAAASLANALGEIAKAYEADHEGIKIKASFAASGALAKQIEAGAPTDVFIAAETNILRPC